ncbi:MAG: LytTR family DNA-binding domain-containing protein [Pseudomonadota bacterium]
MRRLNAIVIDDEPLARINLTEPLARLPGWHVVCELADGEGATPIIEQLRPDVVFLDIQMPGQSGMALARELVAHPWAPLIVFVTAFDRYSIQAFELYAVDYLLKPFDDERLGRTLERIAQLVHDDARRTVVARQQRDCVEETPLLEQLVIRSAGSFRIVRLDEIHWIRASGNYVEVRHDNGQHLQRVGISALSARLDPARFCRIHRSAIVALRNVREFVSHPEGAGEVVMADNARLSVSARYRDALFAGLGVTAASG